MFCTKMYTCEILTSVGGDTNKSIKHVKAKTPEKAVLEVASRFGSHVNKIILVKNGDYTWTYRTQILKEDIVEAQFISIAKRISSN